MTANTVNMAAILKTVFPNGLPKDATYRDNPAMALMPKQTDFYGDFKKVPLKYAPNAGRSSAFATAQNNSSNVKNIAFLIDRESDYAVAKLSNELILASKNNAGAFVSALKQEIDSAQQNIANSAAQAIYGTGSGSVGRISAGSTVGSPTITLANPEDVVFFEVGYKIQLSTANGGGSVKAGTATITGVNRVTGQLSFGGNLTAEIATAAANDYIFIEGDYDSKMKGFAGWLPSVAPTAGDNWFGVDRSTDVTRLAGWRGDLSSLPIEEALIEGGYLIGRDGGKVDYVFMSFDKYSDLIKSLGAKVQFVDVLAKDAGIGFQGVKVNVGKSIATVIPDRNCPSDRMFMISMDTWKLSSLEGMPMILDMDGLKSLRVSNADALEIRVGYYANVYCEIPGHNGNFQI
jgi:hypothetical protein